MEMEMEGALRLEWKMKWETRTELMPQYHPLDSRAVFWGSLQKEMKIGPAMYSARRQRDGRNALGWSHT